MCIRDSKKTLVYGGANIGLMECIAKAAKDNGSMIMGVIPVSYTHLDVYKRQGEGSVEEDQG